MLLVVSIVTGGILGRIAQEARLRKQHELQLKLIAIEDALSKTGVADRYLPCPADGTILLNAAGFGQQTSPPGACTSGSPTGTFSDGNKTVGGVVPVKALGLPDEYAFDPWGGRFAYVVDKRVTTPGSLDLYQPDGRPVGGLADPTRLGSITINDHFEVGGASAVTVRTGHAIAAVISHGENGHGAFQVSGSRKTAGSHNSDEQQNCHCDDAANAQTFDPLVVMQASASNPNEPIPNTFDDVVRYYRRGNFLSVSDRLTEGH